MIIDSDNPPMMQNHCYAQPNICLYNIDNKELMVKLPNESIDVICIDPPYLYLKKQKLEQEFDEQLFFSECKRLLTKKGFIVLFGRGTSFYRWNYILSNLGFTFKEEIIWNKTMVSNPAGALLRQHETISLFTKKGKINKVRIPYTESRTFDMKNLFADIKRIKSALNNKFNLKHIEDYLENGILEKRTSNRKHGVSLSTGCKKSVTQHLSPIIAIEKGLIEKSIISINRDHYNTIHPTQKPVRLLERLLSLVIPKDKPREEIMVADFFGGSFSTMEAVYNLNMKGVACEIDKEYFEVGKKRIENLKPIQMTMFE